MASSLENVRRGTGTRLGLYTLMPLAVALVIVYSIILGLAGGSSGDAAIGAAQTAAKGLVGSAQGRLDGQGYGMLAHAEHVLQAAAPGAVENILNPSRAATAALTRSVLQPLNSRLNSMAPEGCVMFIIAGNRIAATLNTNPEHTNYQLPAFDGAGTQPVLYQVLSGEGRAQLNESLQSAAGEGDVLLQYAVASITASDGRRVGSLLVGRLLNNNTELSVAMRDQYSAKLSVLSASGTRVATSLISGEQMGFGSRSAVATSRLTSNPTYAGLSSDEKYIAAYAPLMAGPAAVGYLEVLLPADNLTSSSILSYILAIVFTFAAFAVGHVMVNANLKKTWQTEVEEPLGEIIEGIGEVQNVMNTVTEGDYNARVTLTDENEIKALSDSMNAMLDSISALMQTEGDRDRLQKQIGDLLDIVSSSAEGDLTRRAEVTADVMGALADSFNMMSEQLGALIHEVQSTTTQVGMSTTDIVDSTEEMAHGAEEQVLQINNAATAIEAMAVAISQVAENADAAVEAGRRTTEAALKGGEAVAKAIDAMYRIRNTVQQTADRIKRLGESSQEIGDIVHLIDNIATQTNLLALNAAIEAARAGEAGRGFGVVADEVRRLADRSTKAANDISTLVQGIQAEVTESVAAMEQGVAEVADGVNLADEAGNALNEIVSVAQQSADLIQEISLSSRQQRTASESVVEQMGSISQFSEQAATSSQQSAAAAAQLGELSDRLRASVSRFRLPE